ncbi:hypothetical protein FJZ53_01295 [Candidatus Woesearchaeota archaeon]|nr:hypothetical protein [Candidatus Woesearchaeota archaeon]
MKNLKRNILKGMSIAAISIGLLVSSPTITPRLETSYAEEFGCNLKEDQVKRAYEEYYETYPQRKNRIAVKEGRYIANYADKEIEVPKRFIEEFLNHLEQAKEQGYFEYLFHEDLNHCHAGLPEEHFKKEYEGLSMAEIREKSLKDPKLMHLYHSRENLTPESPKKNNRNFLGYFDGRKIRLIHPKKENEHHTVFDYDKEEMKEHDSYQTAEGLLIYFQAHKNGLFQLKDGTRLDIEL